MTADARGTESPAKMAIDANTYELARRAMFSAASRVLSYHAAALDAKVARFNLSQSAASVYLPPRGVEAQRG